MEAQGYELALLEKYTSPEELIAAVADVDAMIIRSDKATKEVIDAAKKLKVIVRAGAGYDNIDLQACTDHGVVAMNTPGQNSNAVAELVFGMAVYLARNFYNGKSGHELKGKKIGVHAYGNVGQPMNKSRLRGLLRCILPKKCMRCVIMYLCISRLPRRQRNRSIMNC